jgi:hypothetical protein
VARFGSRRRDRIDDWRGRLADDRARYNWLGSPVWRRRSASNRIGKPPLPTSLLEELAQGLNQGNVGYGEALDELVRAEVALIPREQNIDVEAIKARIEEELATAAMGDSIALEITAQGGTVAELRPDLSPALAERLGIADPDRPLTESGIAHLLKRAAAGRR